MASFQPPLSPPDLVHRSDSQLPRPHSIPALPLHVPSVGLALRFLRT